MSEECCSVSLGESLKESTKKLVSDSSLVSNEGYRYRVGECESCEHLIGLKRCGICGCFVHLKARFNSMECPEGRW